jgi:sulfide dehydrogenase cytochrome subunit
MSARHAAVVAAFVLTLGAAAQAAALGPPAGASSCSGCHPAGDKMSTPVPPLAGRSAAEIVTMLQAFRAGQRPATVMERIAKGFSDDEVRAIAEWYATQK